MSHQIEELNSLFNEALALLDNGRHAEALADLGKCLSILTTIEISLAAVGEGTETTVINLNTRLRESDRARDVALVRSQVTHLAIEASIRANSGRDGIDLMALLKGRKLLMRTEFLRTKRQFGDLGDFSVPLSYLDAQVLYTDEAANGARLCVVEFYYSTDGSLWCVVGTTQGDDMHTKWHRVANGQDARSLKNQTLVMARAESLEERADALDTVLATMNKIFAETVDEVCAWRPHKVIIIPHRFLNLLPWHTCRSITDSRMMMERVPLITYASNTIQYDWCRDIGYRCEKADPGYTTACIDVSNTVSGWAVASASTVLLANHKPLIILNPKKTTLMIALKAASNFFYFGHATAEFERYEHARFATYEGPTTFADLLTDDIGSEISLGILAGCETGLNPNISDIRDEYYGLDGALCARGTATVISSLWPVDDVGTFLLSFFIQRRYLEATRSPAALLNSATQWLRSGAWYDERDEILQHCDFDVMRQDIPDAVKVQMLDASRRFLTSFSNLNPDSFSHPVHWATWRCLGWGGSIAV